MQYPLLSIKKDRIKTTTVFFTGLMDTICPPSAQFAIYNKITAPKDMHIYPDFGHEALPKADDKILSAMKKALYPNL